jgi:small-conductance mechanosensitive channel
MSAVLAGPAEAVTTPHPGPALWFLATVTAIALATTWLLRRMGRAPALAATHRWIPIVYVACWAAVAGLWLRRLVPDEGAHGLARAAALVVLAVAALPWLRNVFHAVVFGIENRYRGGDDLRVGQVEGRLAAVSQRAIVLRAIDGTEIAIPHSSLARENVVRLNLAVRDAPCEIVLPVPTGMETEDALRLARAAAALSPYAAPRCAPRVVLVSDGAHSQPQVRLRGFVFDREHEASYRTDVAARFLRRVRGTVEGEPPAVLETAK